MAEQEGIVEGQVATIEPTTPEGQNVTLSPAELNKRVQSETDKRVTQAVKTNTDNMLTEFTTERTELKERIKKLEEATLSEKEREERARLEKDNELKTANQQLMGYKFIEINNVENDFKSLLTATTEEGLKTQLEAIEAIVKKRVDDAMASFRGSGETGRPESGSGTPDTFVMPTSHDELQKVWVQIKNEKGNQAAEEYYNRASKFEQHKEKVLWQAKL